MDGIWRWIGQTNPDTWAAGAGWTTVLIAIAASVAAFRQVGEAKSLRREQAQPYVIAYMESSPASEQLIDLVIKNVGTTPARDIRITSEPPLVRTPMHGDSESDREVVAIPDVLPMLVPGQEWRVYWDSGIERRDKKLPDRYEVTAEYKDSRNKAMDPTKAILDWSSQKIRLFARVYSTHDAAKALVEIKSHLAELSRSGLTVYTKDGDAADNARREARAKIVQRLQNLKLVPSQGDGPSEDDATSQVENTEPPEPNRE